VKGHWLEIISQVKDFLVVWKFVVSFFAGRVAWPASIGSHFRFCLRKQDDPSTAHAGYFLEECLCRQSGKSVPSDCSLRTHTYFYSSLLSTRKATFRVETSEDRKYAWELEAVYRMHESLIWCRLGKCRALCSCFARVSLIPYNSLLRWPHIHLGETNRLLIFTGRVRGSRGKKKHWRLLLWNKQKTYTWKRRGN